MFNLKKISIYKQQKGFAALLIAILIMVVTLGIVLSIALLTWGEQKISDNIIKSAQAYYTAEAGIEDALLRLSKAMNWASPYQLNVGANLSDVEISDIVGGTRIITSKGNTVNRVRKIEVVYVIEKADISFYYGAQVGDGGMVMGNNSAVQGNVFSNGSVTGGGTITNSIIVARNGNKIEGITVGENATVHTCKNSTISGDLTYVSGGSLQNCNVGGATSTRPNEINPQNLPISQAQINNWKNDAVAGGIITTDVSIGGIQTLGPTQIGTPGSPKNLTVQNGATLIVKGTIYVTGGITFGNSAIIRLDNSYGPFSGIIIADRAIIVNNGVSLTGSGQAGSYLLILSTKNDATNPVIDVRNNAAGAIFYSNSGLIYLKNNMTAREITGYKIQIENNAVIQYESGLENTSFISGPGGSWEVVSWRETE